MIKYLIISILLFTSTLVYTQTLKGYKIGDNIKYKKTTLKTRIVGIMGTIYTSILSDGRIYKIEFIAGSKTDQKRVSYNDVVRFKDYIEDYFNIDMNEILDSNSLEEKLQYCLAANYNPDEELPYDLVFTLFDSDLAKQSTKETVVTNNHVTPLLEETSITSL